MSIFDKLADAAKKTIAAGRGAVQVVLELKDCLQGGDCRKVLRRLLELYQENGRMFQLLVNSEEKRIEVDVHLKSQADPLRAVVKRYEVVQEDSAHFIVLHDIETSWPWVNTILKTFKFREQRFKLPDEYAELIQLAL